ncbi:hypothetical protein DRB96_39160 [Streptomyces sp. ICC1]|nr:hypothetical protein DRB89_38960 [Streptomyces sp. ICC4]AWZ17176.1 hypothetical protein DRB96_39160 [Streptomyces sp. ICC1]
MRELRTDRRLTGRQLAVLLGWTQSKISKLETGRQTATTDDLLAWADATGHPQAAEELITRLRSLESRSRAWRRQLAAGHKPVQDTLTAEYERTRTFHVWQGSTVVGMLQTAEYARRVFTRYADLHQSVRDTEEAVRARVKRQEMLHWHAELWLDDADSVGVYRKVWQALSDSAVYGADAHRVIARARRALDTA